QNTMSSSTSRLFQPITVGQMRLNHRVVLAPLTRVRTDKYHVPSLPVMKEYYAQRASTPGTFLITEATFIAPEAGGLKHVPGIYNQDQAAAWTNITESVHSKGSFIFCQLWAMGRQANKAHLKEDDPSFSVVGPSAIAIKREGARTPCELTIPGIKDYVQRYTAAARRAVHDAQFDGVEIHGANGYLIDEFLQDVSNQRQDEYGGSVERRSRFGLEVVKAVVDAVGTAKKVGIRLSPWSTFGDLQRFWKGMGMKDPIPQFTHFVTTLKQEFPDLAYIHIIEPEVVGDKDNHDSVKHANNDFLREIWTPSPYLTAGGYDRQKGIREADARSNELVVFGRTFIANPDLPIRLEKDVPLTPYDRTNGTAYQSPLVPILLQILSDAQPPRGSVFEVARDKVIQIAILAFRLEGPILSIYTTATVSIRFKSEIWNHGSSIDTSTSISKSEPTPLAVHCARSDCFYRGLIMVIAEAPEDTNPFQDDPPADWHQLCDNWNCRTDDVKHAGGN
ncbi:putative inactive dehydrogenase EasA, partial [Leucoagaricus sp. SymC.cos]